MKIQVIIVERDKGQRADRNVGRFLVATVSS